MRRARAGRRSERELGRAARTQGATRESRGCGLRGRLGGGLEATFACVGRRGLCSRVRSFRSWDSGAPAGPRSLSGPEVAGQEEGADAGGLSRRGPALPGLRCSSASEPAKMCLVTGPLSGELRSPPNWDPEPLLCHRPHPRPPWARTVALRAHPAGPSKGAWLRSNRSVPPPDSC